jgi:uncharacterized BrkB/YihY/UPF0761 family membrane protein
MEKFWNVVHYFAYKGDYKFHLLFNKINPVLYFYKLPFAKKHFAKRGIDPIEEVNKAYKRPDIGLSSIFAGGFMYILVFLICFGLVNLYSAVVQKELNLKLYHFIAFIVVSFVVNYFLLFRHDKYLSYFKEFEKMSRADKKKWAWISLGVILSILIFSIGSFVFLNYRL